MSLHGPRPFVGLLDQLAPDALRRWVMSLTGLATVGYAAGVWVNAVVEPWSWARRGPEVALVVVAALCVLLARHRPLTAALVLLAAAFAEVHLSFFVYGIAGASTVLAPTMVAATGVLLGGLPTYLAAGLSTGLVLAAAALHGPVPGLSVVELEHLFYLGVSNAVVAVVTAKGLEVFELTARRADAGQRATADLIRHAPDGILALDGEGRILTANPAAGLLLRQTPTTLEGLRLDALPVRLQRDDGGSGLRLDERHEAPLAVRATSPDGRVRHLEFLVRAFERGDGATRRLVVLRDVTERVDTAAREARMDAHMNQTQRLSAVAQLAGGLAHDFNNIFTVIRGAAELVRVEARDDPDGVLESAATIIDAQNRGAELIRQLLTFARPAEDVPEVFAVAEELRELEPIVRGLVGERVRLLFELEASGAVTMDRSRFRQLIYNLVSNARDAMPRGGGLTLSVADPAPGEEVPWLRVSVRDEGQGMDAQTVERMFEPFFTTRRGPGHSGLGLATVHGIVEGAGGSVRVESAPGEGTAVHVLLPRSPTPEPS